MARKHLYEGIWLMVARTFQKSWGLCWIVNSTSAISKVQMVTRPGAWPHRQPNNIDLLVMIADLTKELGQPNIITWIKGHQDATKDISKLSRNDAKNRIAVDALATEHWVEKVSTPSSRHWSHSINAGLSVHQWSLSAWSFWFFDSLSDKGVLPSMMLHAGDIQVDQPGLKFHWSSYLQSVSLLS